MIVTIDTGGTKTLIAQFGPDGPVGSSIKFPTPQNKDDYVALVRKTLQETFADQPVEAVVVGIPGIIKNGVALWCNQLEWKDFDVVAAFTGVLGAAPILVENDANLGGLGEARLLDPIPTSVLYVTISTGIGTGIITNGRIDPGLRLSEGGQMLVEFEGKVRQWESFASGQAILATYGKYARDITDPATWEGIADRISRGFLDIIPLVQPDIVIVGGSMGTHFEKYRTLLEKDLQEKLPPHIPCPRFVAAQHPEKAVIYGCYYYAVDYLASR
jgi:predicted NBD/HSP70 family sugar kinase